MLKKLFGIKLVSIAACAATIAAAGCGGTNHGNSPTASGNANLSPKKINNAGSPAIRVSAPEADAAEPAIAAAPDESVFVVWVEHLPEKRADVFVRRFGSDQKPLGDAVRVNPEPGGATAWRGDAPSVKIGADGTVYIGWTARVEAAEGAATDLYLSVSRDGGKSFAAPVKVNDDTAPASHGMHSLEIDRSGRVYLAWLDERYLKNAANQPPMPVNDANANAAMNHEHAEPNGEVYFAVSNDGGKTFSANKKIAGNVCPCCKTSLAGAPDGTIYVGWRQVLEGDFRHVAVSASTDGGNNFTPLTVVSDDQWQINACPVSGAGMTVDAANTLKIAWFTAGRAGTPGIYTTQSSDGGKTFAPRKLLSDQSAGGTPVVLNAGNGGAAIVFSGIEKNTHTFLAASGSTDFTEQNQIADADLAGAVFSNNKILAAFVRTAGEKRKVFLAEAK